ncbi:hypothetical protein SAMN05660420_03410 [Desulfuromusa kysingii]|uniref:Uncharacterized protein n=2 Tax=Desulfuromusa kysingii TaxID=37625 RepID=A0A1H4EJ87_9BACT|nr:hypothetical protein SAMN05660420_03410 [Desulfuromusa kysingii]
MKFTYLSIFFFLCFPYMSMAESTQRYVAPPIDSTTAYVPIISDEEMEKCVKLYNEAKWISEKLETTYVDNYNEKSVKSYNKMVEQNRAMLSKFNTYCAGKRSYSACKAAQKLNKEQGLPYQKCVVDK